jgi:hypothetical protein
VHELLAVAVADEPDAQTGDGLAWRPRCRRRPHLLLAVSMTSPIEPERSMQKTISTRGWSGPGGTCAHAAWAATESRTANATVRSAAS